MIDLRPSNSYIWSRCAAAPTFQARVPPTPDTDAAREGTAAAWVAECVLKGDAYEAADLVGRTHSNGWLVEPDMGQHVQGYIDLVRSFGGETTAEQFVRLNEFIAGTLDSSTALASVTLRVTDLKYGYQIVEVFELPQLIIYGAAELNRLNAWSTVKEIVLGIYQPRAFHPEGVYRTWRITPAELWKYANDLIAAGWECQKPNPIATPGPQCKNCNAITSCAANAFTVYANHQVIEDRRQRRMTADELARELDFIRQHEALFEARASAIKAEAAERARNGEHLAGWHMKPRYGNRRFKYGPETIHFMTGVDATDKKTVTPAELERRGADVRAVELLAETPVIGHKLDRMPGNFIAKAFAPK